MRRKDEFTAIRRIIGGMALPWRRSGFVVLLVMMATNSCWATTTYDAASAFEQGWITHNNPNGVWSYGYSSGFANAVTLYNQTAQPGVNGPNAQYWLSSSVNIGESPAAEFNNGPAFSDGNVSFLANEFVLVAGIGGQYSDLIFTAPADGVYSVACTFRGAQNGIGTVVAVVANGNILFSSSVTAVGQTVPFDTEVTLTAGSTVVFSVGPGGGLQNTGLSVTITTPPAPANFVYANNEPLLGGQNSVSGFSVGPNGALTPVAGSPFLTGGSGLGNPFQLPPSRIAVTTIPGNFLYASNDSSNSISGFSIDTTTGVLTPIPGSPFATGAVNAFGIPLGVTPDGQFLYAGNFAANNISAFSVGSNGALTPIPGSPFPVGGAPLNMKVSPDGKFLAVGLGPVAMFSIGSNGALTPVPGSPFSVPGFAVSLDVNCASNLLFASTNLIGQGGVNVLNIASNGVLTPIAGSPFTFGGSLSVFDVLSPDDQHLFVSNAVSNTMASLNVASGGSVTGVSGSPFPTTLSPVTTATNQAGTLLYVAAPFPGNIIGFNIASNGALSPVPGSPFSTGVSGLSSLPSVVVFPPKSCKPAPPVPMITSISPASAVAGGAGFTLMVSGTNFVSGSTVNFDANALATTFVNATELSAATPAPDIAVAGTFNVTVTNPGGLTSNAASFTVLTPQQATEAIIDSVNLLFSQGVLNGGQDNSLVVKLQHAINKMNAGNRAPAIGNLNAFIDEVNDLLSSGVLSPSQAASLVTAAQSVIAAI